MRAPVSRTFVAATVLALVASACGNREPHADVVAAAEGRVVTEAAGAGTDAGAGTATGGVAAPGADAGQGGAEGRIDPAAPGANPAVPAAGAEGPTAGAASGEPIRVASVSTMSGPIGGAMSAGPRAVQAWAAAVNAAGGINGRPVEALVVEDGGDPARHNALVREMVEERGVVAFVHELAPQSGQSSVSYLNERQIPVVGSQGGSTWFYENSVFFPQMTSDPDLAPAFAGGTARALAGTGATKIALLYCVEITACRRGTDPAEFRAAGLEVVYESGVSVAAPDYTAQCLGARNAGADAMFVILDGQSIIRLAANCAGIGYNPRYAVTPHTAADNLLRSPHLEGTIVPALTAPWFLSTQPAIAEFHQAMSQYAPGVPVDGSASHGWTSAKLLERALRAAEGEPTPVSILAALRTVAGDDLGGLTQPLTFEAGAANNAVHMARCFWVVTIAGGQWTAPDGGERHCD